MELVQVTPVSPTATGFIRVIVRYGAHEFTYDPKRINKIFAYLRATLKSIIYIPDNNSVVSVDKPSLVIKSSILASTTIDSPLTFQAHFNYDLDSEGAGLWLKLRPSLRPCNSCEHQLHVDVLHQLDEGEDITFDLLTEQVLGFLNDYQSALLYLLTLGGAIPTSLIAYYFLTSHGEEGVKIVRVFYPEKEESSELETQWRSRIHDGMHFAFGCVLTWLF